MGPSIPEGEGDREAREGDGDDVNEECRGEDWRKVIGTIERIGDPVDKKRDVLTVFIKNR